METRQLGASGVAVPVLGLGCWAWGNTTYWANDWTAADEEAARSAVNAALAAGASLFDTAEAYDFPQGRDSSERILGAALAGRDAQIVTKFAALPQRFGAGSVVNACKSSLAKLGRDSVDLYLLHWPGVWQNDAYLDGLAECYEQGLVKAVGVSNYDEARLRAAHAKLASRGVPLACNQVQFSLIYPRPLENGLKKACDELGVTLMAWSPAGQGILTGKYSASNPPTGARAVFAPVLEEIDPLLSELAAVGEANGGKTAVQVALRWLIDQENVVVIPGARNAAQAEELVGALGWSLDAATVDRLTQASLDLQRRVRAKGGLVALADNLLSSTGV